MNRRDFLAAAVMQSAAVVLAPAVITTTFTSSPGELIGRIAGEPEWLACIIDGLAGPPEERMTLMVGTRGPGGARLAEQCRNDYRQEGEPFGDSDAGLTLWLEQQRLAARRGETGWTGTNEVRLDLLKGLGCIARRTFA